MPQPHTPGPRQRASDVNPWPPERLDALNRQVDAFAPTALIAGVLASRVDDHTRDIETARNEMLKRLDELAVTCNEIRDQCKLTNGRVTQLEAGRIADEAVRAERAQVLEDRRSRAAHHIAAHGWVRPTLAGGAVAVAASAIARLLGI